MLQDRRSWSFSAPHMSSSRVWTSLGPQPDLVLEHLGRIPSSSSTPGLQLYCFTLPFSPSVDGGFLFPSSDIANVPHLSPPVQKESDDWMRKQIVKTTSDPPEPGLKSGRKNRRLAFICVFLVSGETPTLILNYLPSYHPAMTKACAFAARTAGGRGGGGVTGASYATVTRQDFFQRSLRPRAAHRLTHCALAGAQAVSALPPCSTLLP